MDALRNRLRTIWQTERWQRLILSTVAAVVLALCFSPSGIWNPLRAVLAWFALAPLVYALRPTTDSATGVMAPLKPRSAGGIGYVFGLVLHLAGAYWLKNISMGLDFNGIDIGFIPYLAVALIEAGWFAVFAVVYVRLVGTRNGGASVVAFAMLWVVLEWLRTQGAYAFPWFPLAATQVRYLPVLQWCAVTGQWGLTAVIAWSSAMLATAVGKPLAWRPLALVAGVVLALHAGGVVLLPKGSETAKVLRVAVAQAAYTGHEPDESRRDYLDVTQQAVQNTGKPLDLVVWPETVIFDGLLNNAETFRAVSEAAMSLQTPILVGTDRTDRSNRNFNSAVLLGKRGNVMQVYDKVVIVPLGEFFPFREVLDPIYQMFPTGSNDLTPGAKPGVLSLETAQGAVPFGSLICYESAFGWYARAEVLQGAQFLTVSTNDLWFGVSDGPLQHADLSILRAVETRRWVARAASSGESRLIAPTGEVVGTIPLMKRDSIAASIVPSTEQTFYVRFGDWFVWCCCLYLVGYVLLSRHNKRAA